MKASFHILTNEGLHGGRLLRFDTLQSTNLWAMENVASLGDGDVVWAISQTAGMGRFDRQWQSPDNLCLTVSIILKPPPADEIFISTISQLAALAVAATLEKSAIPAAVKWPNDVLVNGKKIAGILAERDSNTGLLVLGIGLNVNMTAGDFNNAELMQPATSMRIESNNEFHVENILKTLIAETEKSIAASTRSAPSFPFSAWDKKDFLKGKQISVHTTEAVISGSYSGIDDSGRLRLTDSTGDQHLFWSGDVSVSQNVQQQRKQK